MRQVLIKVWPGLTELLSGIVTSSTKVARLVQFGSLVGTGVSGVALGGAGVAVAAGVSVGGGNVLVGVRVASGVAVFATAIPVRVAATWVSTGTG